MNSEQTSHDLIDAYLQDNLSGGALGEFESKMKADPELAAFIRRQQMILKLAKDHQRHAFIQALNEIPLRKKIPWYKRFIQQLPDPFPSTPATTFPGKMYRPIGWAMLFVITGFSAWYLITSQKKFSRQTAVSTTFDLIATTIQSPVMGTNKDSLKLEGGRLFNLKFFDQAIPFYEDALREDSNDVTIRLQLGYCRKETGQYDEALTDFQQVVDAQAADSDIAWLAMAEIFRKKGDLAQCEELLSKVEAFTYSRAESRATAKKMLEDIKAEKSK